MGIVAVVAMFLAFLVWDKTPHNPEVILQVSPPPIIIDSGMPLPDRKPR